MTWWQCTNCQMAEPIFLSCAEIDSRFPNDFRNRAVDIMQAEKKKFQLQLFQGVEHGFAVRGSDSDPYASMYRPGTIIRPMCDMYRIYQRTKSSRYCRLLRLLASSTMIRSGVRDASKSGLGDPVHPRRTLSKANVYNFGNLTRLNCTGHATSTPSFQATCNIAS